jgi:hypothetical protein
MLGADYRVIYPKIPSPTATGQRAVSIRTHPWFYFSVFIRGSRSISIYTSTRS